MGHCSARAQARLPSARLDFFDLLTFSHIYHQTQLPSGYWKIVVLKSHIVKKKTAVYASWSFVGLLRGGWCQLRCMQCQPSACEAGAAQCTNLWYKRVGNAQNRGSCEATSWSEKPRMRVLAGYRC